MSVANYDDLLQCTYGTSAMSLVTYEVKAEPILQAGVGRIFTRVEVTAECELYAQGDVAGYQATLAAVLADLGTDGRDFIVQGLGGMTEYGLLAANCLDGGPHVSFDMTAGDTALSKKFKLTIKSDRMTGTGPTNSFSVKIHTRPDGLIIVTRSGTVIGPDAPTFYLGTALPDAQKAYPLPKWVMEHEWTSTQDANLSKVTYSITATQNFAALPAATLKDYAVEGDMSTKVDRDEQYRLVTTFSLNLLVVGDPQKLLTQMRGTITAGGAVILRESWMVTKIKEQRLTGTFTTLSSADGARPWLLNWTETIEIKGSDAGYEIKHYPGGSPVLVKRPKSVTRVIQSGSAITCNGKYWKPVPLYTTYVSEPTATTNVLNDVERRTDYHFEMFASTRIGGRLTVDPAMDVFSATIPKITRTFPDNSFYKQVP